MAGVVYYTGAQREFLGVCAREEKSERRRRSKLELLSSPSFLNFQGAFSVNKYEGKCSFSFFFYYISGVRSAGYNLYGKKGKTVPPSRKLQAKGDTSSLRTGKQSYQYRFVLVHVQNYKRPRSLVRSSPHYITSLDIRLWNNKNFPLCVIYLLIQLLVFFSPLLFYLSPLC